MPKTIRNAGLELYSLAAKSGVGIGEACDVAGISRSTPSRWKTGTTPRPQQVSRLKAAIEKLARTPGQDPKHMDLEEAREGIQRAAAQRAVIMAGNERIESKLDRIISALLPA